MGTNLVATSTYAYDSEVGRLTSLTHSDPTSTQIEQYTYLYDKADRIIQTISARDGSSTQTYDATDQLLTADHTTGPDESYTYDANGNRLTAQGQSVSTGSDNRLLDDGTFTYTYDASGNRLTKTRKSSAAASDYTTRYTWDHAHRLTNITILNNGTGGSVPTAITYLAEYTYDSEGRRIKSMVDADGHASGSYLTPYYDLYQGDEVVLSYVDDIYQPGLNLTATHSYLRSPGGKLLLDRNLTQGAPGTGVTAWTLADHQQSVRNLVSDAGGLLEHRNFDRFGNLTAVLDGSGNAISQNQMLSDFGYTGQRYNVSTGLYDSHARWYDPRNGRFLSEDPSGFTGGQDYNLYRYVWNNPLSYTDPTGYCGVRNTFTSSTFNTGSLNSGNTGGSGTGGGGWNASLAITGPTSTSSLYSNPLYGSSGGYSSGSLGVSQGLGILGGNTTTASYAGVSQWASNVAAGLPGGGGGLISNMPVYSLNIAPMEGRYSQAVDAYYQGVSTSQPLTAYPSSGQLDHNFRHNLAVSEMLHGARSVPAGYDSGIGFRHVQMMDQPFVGPPQTAVGKLAVEILSDHKLPLLGVALGGTQWATQRPVMSAGKSPVVQVPVRTANKYPPNNGFQGTPGRASVIPGAKLDRYGGTGGSYLSPAGTPVAARSLPPEAELRPLHSYEVVKPFEVDAGAVAPWFGQPGGGIQYRLGTNTVQDLIDSGHLRPLP